MRGCVHERVCKLVDEMEYCVGAAPFVNMVDIW